MRPPIFVDENGDLSVFATVASTELYLEPIDVRNGEYVAYDSEGRELALDVDVGPKGEERVSVRAAESIPTHANELRRAIVHMLEYIGTDPEVLRRASLSELVAQAQAETSK